MEALPVEQLRPGDLLYFGSLGEKQKRSVTHVALSLGGPDFIHASGSNQGVTLNSFSENSPRFSPWLRSHLLGVRRVF
jgi:cell wall-associated NlpC family hydrolase